MHLGQHLLNPCRIILGRYGQSQRFDPAHGLYHKIFYIQTVLNRFFHDLIGQSALYLAGYYAIVLITRMA